MSTNPTRSRRSVIPVIAVSLALHGAALAAAARIPPAPTRERIEIEVVRRPRPASTLPRPEPEREAPRPPARVVAALAPRAAPPAAPPPALASAPPAPAAAAPRVIPKVGISLGSTVASGGFAVGVGNTAYGRAAEVAEDPASVRRYSGGAPAARVSQQPKVIELPKIAYPPGARRAGIEGQVVLVLRIDARGEVTAVRVVDAPAADLAEAAREGARRFRFTPPLRDGEPVETEIRFNYTFLLE